MRRYDSSLPLVSIHVPKCAGTSLSDILCQWFPGDDFQRHYRPHLDQLPVRHELRGGQCVHGHFNGARGFGVWDFYPQARQFIIFLREPFDRFVSQWLYMNRRHQGGDYVGGLVDNPSFEQWINRRADEQGRQRNSYSPVWFLPLPPGTTPVETQLRELFVFIGLHERMALSMRGLAASLGRPEVALPHLNRTERGRREFERWRGFYERHFQDEYALYQAAYQLHLKQF